MPEVKIKLAENLRERLYFDEDAGILYVNSLDLYRNGEFVTYLNELRKVYGQVKVVQDPEKVARGVARRDQESRIFTEEQRPLAELERILKKAAERFVSDVHLEVRGSDLCVVYFREEGQLRKEEELRGSQIGDRIISALFNNAVAGSHVSISVNEFQFAQLTSFSGRKSGREVGLVLPDGVEGIRLQRGPMNGGHYAVLRIFYKTSRIEVKRGKNFEETVKLTLTEYGYKPWTIEKIRPALEMGDGLTVIAGPTGSGKSTALKLFLEIIHELYPYKSIFTIENPPEYQIKGAKQLPVPESKGGFAEALRAALRSDPDIIMVGEVREPETAKTVVDAVLTGHQVFTTVHARDVATIVDRLRGLGVNIEELIEDNLIKLLVAQRLIPKNCPKCGVVVEVNGVKGYHGKGCSYCGGTGVKGRVAVEECVNYADLFLWGLERLRERLSENGRTMLVTGLRLVLAGVVSPYVLISSLGHWTREDVYLAEGR